METPKNHLISNALDHLKKRPIIFFPAAVFLAVSYLLSFILRQIISNSDNNTVMQVIAYGYSLIFIAIASIVTCFLVSLAYFGINERKIKINTRIWFVTFLILLFSYVFSIIANIIGVYAVKIIGTWINLGVTQATYLYVFFLAIVFFGLVIFIVFSPIYSALGNGFFNSLKKSAILVWENYFKVAISSLVVLLVYKINSFIPIVIMGDIIGSVLISTYIVALMVLFIKENDIRTR